MKKLSILFITLLSIGCTEPSNSQMPDSALPQTMRQSNDTLNCEIEIPESEQRGYEPALNAWLKVSDSIFVGTIKSVSPVNAPVHHIYNDKDGSHNRGIILAEDCPTGNILEAIRFEFEDVETLYGKEVGSSLTIQMSRMQADRYLQIGFAEDGKLRDIEGRLVYQPNSRIGAALFTDNAGNSYWNYRQFEVIDNKVYLQDIDSSKHPCWDKPDIIGIPNSLHGSSYNDFINALTSDEATAEITLAQQEYLQYKHDRWAAAIASGEAQQHTYTICEDGYLPNDNDPTIKNDPTAK